MKTKNPLSLWNFPYSRKYYLTHPWKLLRSIHANIHNLLHRAKYGFSYTDVWDFCTWYPQVGSEALKFLALHNDGYPGIIPWETPEEWHDYLLELAHKLERCASTIDFEAYDKNNEYSEQFYEMSKTLHRYEIDPETGFHISYTDETPEFIELRDKYFAREKELAEEYKQFRKDVGAELFENLERIWD